MQRSEFDILLEERLNKIKDTLASKGKEYSVDKDVFHVFKRASKIGKCSPEKGLIGMYMKHLISVLDIVDNIENGISYPTPEVINEKIGDSVNYLILLEGLLIERYKEETEL